MMTEMTDTEDSDSRAFVACRAEDESHRGLPKTSSLQAQ